MAKENYLSNSYFRPQGFAPRSANSTANDGILPPANADKTVEELLRYYQELQPNLNAADFMAYAEGGGFSGDRLAAMPGNEGFLPSQSLPTAARLAWETVGRNMDGERTAAGDPFHATNGPDWDPENDARRSALEWVINKEGLLNNKGYLGTLKNQLSGNPNQIKDMRLQALLGLARDK